MVKKWLIFAAFLLPVFIIAQIDYTKQIKNIPPLGRTDIGNTWAGPNTFNGANILQCKNFQSTRCVDSANNAGWSGADVCAWITSAQADLPSTGGTIKVADGTYTACAGGFTLGSSTKPVSLYLGQGGGAGGTILTVNAQILVACSNCTITGVAGSSTTIFQGASFPASTPVISLSSGTTPITGATVTGIRVSCNSAANSIGFENADALDFSGFLWDVATGCTKYGFWYEGTGATSVMSVGEKLWSTHSGTTAIDFYIHNLSNFRAKYLTAVSLNGVDVDAQGILVDGGNAEIDDIHCEFTTVCLDIGTTTSATVLARNLLGNSSVPTLVKIENTAANKANLYHLLLNGGTNNVQDLLTGNPTITDTYLTHYQTTPGTGAIVERSGDYPTLVAAQDKFLNTAGTIDGRIGIGAFSSTGFGIGTNTSNLLDLYANANRGASVEFNGTNSDFVIFNYLRQIETTQPVGVAGSTACYADSTAHNFRCSLNNSTWGPLVTAAPCYTSQKAETAADTNLLTCAIPAQAGSYRLRFLLNVSASNTATLGWTATWTDSNGNAFAPTNLLAQLVNSANPALTFTLNGTTGDIYGYADIDVNNAGTSVVIKLTFSGTSFTGKASATVERII